MLVEKGFMVFAQDGPNPWRYSCASGCKSGQPFSECCTCM